MGIPIYGYALNLRLIDDNLWRSQGIPDMTSPDVA